MCNARRENGHKANPYFYKRQYVLRLTFHQSTFETEENN